MQFIKLKLGDKEIEVSTDYYTEGGLRMPVGLTRAFNIADSYNCRLPTREEVDLIWREADIKLNPIPMTPSSEMTSYSYFKRHNDLIEEQLNGMSTHGKLIAGHKKDILGTDRNSPRVYIYGWHRKSGVPIQPPSRVHHREYADYSHGLRLVRDI